MPHDQEQSGKEQSFVKTILIVEDDVDIGEFLVQAIEQETPYLPLLVPDGFQALKVVHDIKPDLFLLDYGLPEMNGIELYDQLHAKKDLEDIPTIMLSARLPKREVDKREIASLRKPFQLQELLDAFENLLA